MATASTDCGTILWQAIAVSSATAAAEREMAEVNVVAVVTITGALVPGMLARAAADGRRAGLIIVARMAAFQPLPYLAPCGATKIFDLVYAEALAGALSRAPIDVLALCSGGTETVFMERAGLQRHVLARLDPPRAGRVRRRGDRMRRPPCRKWANRVDLIRQ